MLGNVSFFKWFSKFSNSILSNGSESVRNVIQMAFNWQFLRKITKIALRLGFLLSRPNELRGLGAPPSIPRPEMETGLVDRHRSGRPTGRVAGRVEILSPAGQAG